MHALLRHPEHVGFAGAPRFLGIDEMGREILTYIEGDVPDNISPSFTDRQLVEAAELLRRYHTTRPPGPCFLGTGRASCHNDVSPDNTGLVEGRPTAMIDFDMAALGPRIRDLSLGAFLWLDVGCDGLEPEVQRRRLRLWCDAYGLVERSSLIDDMKERIRETVIRRRSQGAEDCARWWGHQLAWWSRTSKHSESDAASVGAETPKMFARDEDRRTRPVTTLQIPSRLMEN